MRTSPRENAPLAVVLITFVASAVVAAPRASAGDAPTGRLGDTFRSRHRQNIADVTVSSVQPVDPPPGFAYKRSRVPLKAYPNSGVARADVTVQTIKAPNPYQMATDFTFDGVTLFADAYTSRPSDAPDALDDALANAPPGSTVHGGVYWDTYRDPVSNVVLLDRKTGYHLAQWNL